MSATRRALVTGGSGGIGAAICRRLAASGLFVHVHANRSLESALSTVEQIVAAGGRAVAVQFDITDAAATLTQLEIILEQGPIQVLVNNAGIHDDAVFPGMSREQWQGVIDVSVNGFYNVTQPLMLPMIRTRFGRIINISSVSALLGNRGQVNYAAAKGALNAATKAFEPGSREPGHHRQCGCARHHLDRHERQHLRCGRHQQPRAHEARGTAEEVADLVRISGIR